MFWKQTVKKMKTTGDSDDTTIPITIYAMPGSQYTGKVLVALDSWKIPHYCEFVSFDPRTRVLPSGGKMVPEITVGDGDAREIVPDSEAILHWMDENRGTKLFPTNLSSDLSLRASNGILSGAVLYYNWVHPEGYARSMRISVQKYIPPWIFMFRNSIADYFTSAEREKFRASAAKQLGLDENDLDDEAKVRCLLVEELAFFQSHLKLSSEEQPYLLHGVENVSAVDCSVYAQLQRLIGNMGDVNVPPSFPELERENPQLSRLWEWHDIMKSRHPILFMGKRKPQNELIGKQTHCCSI